MSEKETACLRDITETDIMEYMQGEHPHNETELWKMKHATPARIGIGRCGARYTTEAQLRFLAAHAAANDAVFNEVPEEVVKSLAFLRCGQDAPIKTKCSSARTGAGSFCRMPDKKLWKTVSIIRRYRSISATGCARRLSGRTFRICFQP